MTLREVGRMFYVASLTMWLFVIVYTPLALFGGVPWLGFVVFFGVVGVVLLFSIYSWLRTFHAELDEVRLESDDVARCDVQADQHAAEE